MILKRDMLGCLCIQDNSRKNRELLTTIVSVWNLITVLKLPTVISVKNVQLTHRLLTVGKLLGVKLAFKMKGMEMKMAMVMETQTEMEAVVLGGTGTGITINLVDQTIVEMVKITMVIAIQEEISLILMDKIGMIGKDLRVGDCVI